MPCFKDSCVISLTIKCNRLISGTEMVIGWGKHPCSCHFCIYKQSGFHRNSQFKNIFKNHVFFGKVLVLIQKNIKACSCYMEPYRRIVQQFPAVLRLRTLLLESDWQGYSFAYIHNNRFYSMLTSDIKEHFDIILLCNFSEVLLKQTNDITQGTYYRGIVDSCKLGHQHIAKKGNISFISTVNCMNSCQLCFLN